MISRKDRYDPGPECSFINTFIRLNSSFITMCIKFLAKTLTLNPWPRNTQSCLMSVLRGHCIEMHCEKINIYFHERLKYEEEIKGRVQYEPKVNVPAPSSRISLCICAHFCSPTAFQAALSSTGPHNRSCTLLFTFDPVHAFFFMLFSLSCFSYIIFQERLYFFASVFI